MKIIMSEGKEIASWCSWPEEGALEQARALSRLPFLHRRVCLMPDTHQGYGMPIGGVIATKGVVIPNAVGVDIGCGMAALKTSLCASELTTDKLKDILAEIRNTVPVGFNKHSKPQEWLPSDDKSIFIDNECPICYSNYENACLSLGTLGGGNHFIEIQKDEDGYIWIMIHSGSRNLGKQVCDHYNKVAIAQNQKWFNYTKDLAFLPVASDEGQSYLNEMHLAQEFAKLNRAKMMEAVINAFHEVLGVDFLPAGGILDVHHNYAAIENHYGENVIVHRKGAIRAREGELGIIPGSQGTSSFIVRGKGNRESFMSCSHGAGRKMSRKKAREILNLSYEQSSLEKRGILHGIRCRKDLEEAPNAYKDIDVVMKEQEDLVKIVTKLEPIAVIKG